MVPSESCLGKDHKGTLSWSKLWAISLTAEVVCSALRLGQASPRGIGPASNEFWVGKAVNSGLCTQYVYTNKMVLGWSSAHLLILEL